MIQIKNLNKISQFSKLNFRFEIWIYLVSHVIQKLHDEFQVNESVCIAKFEQQCVITIIKIFENEPKFRWLDEKIFHCTCQLYSNTFNDRCTLKAQAITSNVLRFFSKYFLHRQHNRYIGFALYTISLILVSYISLKCLSHPPYDRS